ncbi:MAG TPA: sugar transferase [Verrucomicrobiae bacterium]|nr:sugar transferase [Verrucomicrobiae bacterium]
MRDTCGAEINDGLLRHYGLARSPWGRAELQIQLAFKRLCWHCRVHSGPVVKRSFDLIVSLLLLLLFSPVLFAIGLLVKLEDGGPIIFAQTRVGRFGREFKMFKFRSMCMDAEARLKDLIAKNRHGNGVTFKIQDDPRITRVGRWLRKFSLDELPQLYNVFIGDMSLVGPRPPLPREVKLYSLADRRRLAAPPGITCFWQISGRSEIDFAGQVKLDVSYIESQDFWMDVKILALTLPAVVRAKGAC